MAQYAPKSLYVICAAIWLIWQSASQAGLSGQVKYSYETNYLDSSLTQQIFAQDYLANLRGYVIEDRIGSYGLSFQYQRGAAELKNFTFTNSLNFRDALRLSTSFYRKDYANLLYDNNPIADNRTSIFASYYLPNLPVLTGGFEIGSARAATSEGINKNDKKGELGISYSIFSQNFSARYVRSSLYDDTYFSTGANLVNRDNLLTFNQSGAVGDRIAYTGSYSNQQIYNQVGSSSIYNQKLEHLSATSTIKLTPNININPEYLDTVNLVDYDMPAGQKNYQRSKKIGASISIQPVNYLEFIFNYGTGSVNMADQSSDRSQGLVSRRSSVSFNFAKKLYLNADYRDETYSGANANGKALYLDGYLSYLIEEGIKLTYKRTLNRFSGEVFTLASSSAKNQDLNDWIVGINLANNWYIEGDVSVTTVNTYNYRGVAAAVSYAPVPQNVLELRHEEKFGNEITQTVNYTIDSFKANLSRNGFTLNEQLSLVRSKTTTDTAITDQYGIRNLTDVNYRLGDSTIKFSINSERRDQNSSAYTRMYSSFERNF
ncbi:hypothetical protein HZC34_01580 [Candidatus Saganbacteria bacterium]|nr:hypothetical protein [Candidatus Saganbacteria bacterium]